MNEKLFYVVLIPEEGEPELRKLVSVAEVAALLKQLPPTTRGFGFYGERLEVTAAPWRYLMWSGSAPLPLFDPPKIGRVDKSGNFGHKDDNSPVDKTYAALTASILEEDESRAEAEAAAEEELDQDTDGGDTGDDEIIDEDVPDDDHIDEDVPE